MEKYIGTKIISAEPAYKVDGKIYPATGAVPRSMNRQEGYKVIYGDGYVSWSPKDVFEKAYMKIGNNNAITQQNVDDFIADTEVHQIGNKTTIVKATLLNGFIIVESSSCVDEQNFDMQVGTDICMDKIKDKVWFLLGFLLQSGVSGFKKKEDY